MKHSKLKVTNRDRSILLHIWHWKVSNSALMLLKFFKDSVSCKTGYNRLLELKNHGYIKNVYLSEIDSSVFGLTSKGFKAIRLELPVELEKGGYASECPLHDFYTSSIQHSPWYYGFSDVVEAFTEQQLKLYLKEDYPDWVPKDLIHRSDGYWKFYNEDRSAVVSLEVELSAKSRSEYSSILDEYSRNKKVDYVFWFVRKKSQFRKISNDDSEYSPKKNKYFYFLISDFKQLGIYTPSFSGDFKGRTMAEILKKLKPGTSQEATKNKSEILPIEMMFESKKTLDIQQLRETLKSISA